MWFCVIWARVRFNVVLSWLGLGPMWSYVGYG